MNRSHTNFTTILLTGIALALLIACFVELQRIHEITLIANSERESYVEFIKWKAFAEAKDELESSSIIIPNYHGLPATLMFSNILIRLKPLSVEQYGREGYLRLFTYHKLTALKDLILKTHGEAASRDFLKLMEQKGIVTQREREAIQTAVGAP